VRLDLIRIGFPPNHVHVAEPAVDCDEYTPGTKACLPTVLFFNRVVPYKNPHDLIRAFAIVKRKVPDAILQIVGCRGSHYEDKLRNLANGLGLDKSIEFHPFKYGLEKRDFLRSAWIHVLPSTKEGWGISVLEAAACGTPTVGYNVVGLRDAVSEGTTGFLVPHRAFASLGESIIRLIQNRNLRESMGQNARCYALKFSWDSTVERVIHVLEQAVRQVQDI
jgi:glycosyltransferase involved in cell wall biosynthesis